MRVLLVDDNIDSVIGIGRVLQALGYEVCAALDGRDAIIRAAEFHPDAAVIDLSLPIIDGCGVAERLRAMPETRDAFLIAMTGWGAGEYSARVSAAGFDLHLVKPVSVDTLIGALEMARC